MSQIQYSDIAVEKPDFDELGRRIDGFRAALGEASSADECMAVVREWDALRREVDTWSSLVSLRFHQDTTDAAAKAAREEHDALWPRWVELEVAMKRALLDHPLKGELAERLGAQAFALWRSDVLAFDPKIKEELGAELKLEAEYTELVASARLEFRGETLNVPRISKYRQHADRETRHEAEQVLWRWFADRSQQLDRIYDELVALRTKMAHSLGYDDFVGMGYARMNRIDYDRADVDRLRAGVREHVVPLATELRRRQAADLGVEKLMAWDEAVSDARGNPEPAGDDDWKIARAQEMFDALAPELGAFFRLMKEGRFLDLSSRDGKAGGGFCTSFPSKGMPFVFANFNGTKHDVEVLTHEIGHAFQCHESRGQSLADYLWPTLESCEIHSMSLEFLTWPHMEKFFGDEADRYRRIHLTEALLFLPYGTAVDHFQHEVYSRPGMSPAERNAVWLEMERTYMPWRDWGDLERPREGGRWQLQGHIYRSPFYYVDYVLAQTCALQFWVRAEQDREEALQAYVALCRRGGEAPFQELARSAGLTSPFDPGCLDEVVGQARAVLEG